MKKINGVAFFNATPHTCRFIDRRGGVVELDPDVIVSAKVVETLVGHGPSGCELVRTEFVPTAEGHEIIAQARAAGAVIIVGSIIAAQAYPGDVYAMVPALGYERVPPAEKRMRADKFTSFGLDRRNWGGRWTC